MAGELKSLSVIGAGAWGTALAMVAADGGAKVRLYAKDGSAVASINDLRRSPRLGGITLPASISAAPLADVADDADAVLIAIPAQKVREVVGRLDKNGYAGKPVILCVKGVEIESGKLLTELLAEMLPECIPAIISGPSFALDVARRSPTAVTIAAADLAMAEKVQTLFQSASFRTYTTDDVNGVALGGAAKNVYAIGCGIVEGLGYGESARAGLLARSFSEIIQMCEPLGARHETLSGLSGLGDFVLTATSRTSRNFSAGVMLGQSNGRQSYLTPGAPLAEGVFTAGALVSRARQASIELPVAEAVASIVDGSLSPAEAAASLMGRPLNREAQKLRPVKIMAAKSHSLQEAILL